ncbi:hypothetical protein VKT23_002485 [Stygiomarasmius scandens]|uniref:Uncharacterized protein n=1 Tax=Marasmiellus scandens TaxID=2682957 RepID=A0ABR1K2D2_9AGAR
MLWQTGNMLGGLFAWQHGLIHADETLTEAVLEKSVMENLDREKRDGAAVVLTMRSLTDDDELLPFIEAIPDCFYDFSQNQVREKNVNRFQVLFSSDEPELNIWSRITQLVSKCGYWTGNFQTRSSQACVRAIWAVSQVYISAGHREKYFDLYLQFIRSMPSLLQIVATTSSGVDLCSALAALGIQWMHLDEGFDKQDLVFETFRVISSYIDTALQVSDANLNMIIRALALHWSTPFVKKTISQIGESKAWHILQIFIFDRYLRTMQISHVFLDSEKFENICDAIYPRSQAPLEAENDYLSMIVDYSDYLLGFKQHVNETGVLNDSTDVFVRQYLKIFLSTSKPLCSDDGVRREWRQFVLLYVYRRYEDTSSDVIWGKFGKKDLARIGQCIQIDQTQEPDSVEQSSICLKVTFILMRTFGSRHIYGDRFFPRLFAVLHNSPLTLTYKMCEGYQILKTLLHLQVCIQLVPPRYVSYETLPQECSEQIRAGLVQDYLLPHFLCLNSDSFGDTLTIAIISRYIDELSGGSSIASYCVGILTRIGYWSRELHIHEKIQVAFAESVAKLVQAALSGLLDTEFVESTLLDVMTFFPYQSWTWITSQQSAKILLDAISWYGKPEDVQISERYSELQETEEEANQELREHCRKLLSTAKDADVLGSG